jgi:tetratricopeptide (TPR) repeat protein
LVRFSECNVTLTPVSEVLRRAGSDGEESGSSEYLRDRRQSSVRSRLHLAHRPSKIITMTSNDAAGNLGGARVWNLTGVRNPNFVGRSDLLDELRQMMTAGRPVQAINGLGGVGKSQVAAEYCHRHRGDYEIIWWVRADGASAIAASLANLSAKLGRQLSELAPPDMIVAAVASLLARRQTLVVFDAAPDADTLRPFLAIGGHILITSRNPNWGDLAQSQPLRVLDDSDAIAFLRRRTGRNDSDESAAKLTNALGRLPLALEQAAACIEQSRLSFDDYLNRFETEWAELLQEGRLPVDYPHTVAMTWGLSFSAVEVASPAAADLMHLCAYLASDQVTRKLLRDGQQHLPVRILPLVEQPMLMDQAVAQLLKYSLIDAEGQRLAVHRLVAAVTRDRLEDEDQEKWCAAAVKFLAGSFTFDSANVKSWVNCDDWLPHVRQAGEHAERLGVAPDETADMLNDAGRYLLKKGQYVEAKQLFERAMRISQKRYGEGHPKLSAIANNLGRVNKELGDDAAAMELYQKVLSIDQSTYGESHFHVAEVINNYGVCLQRKGDSETARRQFEWAAQVYESKYGPNAPKLASILNNLGYVLKSEGDIEKARIYLLRALTIAEKNIGDDHPTTARILYNLASVHRAAGHFPMAREHLERALTIDEAALGTNHPDVALDCAALAELLGQMGDVQLSNTYRARVEQRMDGC